MSSQLNTYGICVYVCVFHRFIVQLHKLIYPKFRSHCEITLLCNELTNSTNPRQVFTNQCTSRRNSLPSDPFVQIMLPHTILKYPQVSSDGQSAQGPWSVWTESGYVTLSLQCHSHQRQQLAAIQPYRRFKQLRTT